MIILMDMRRRLVLQIIALLLHNSYFYAVSHWHASGFHIWPEQFHFEFSSMLFADIIFISQSFLAPSAHFIERCFIISKLFYASRHYHIIRTLTFISQKHYWLRLILCHFFRESVIFWRQNRRAISALIIFQGAHISASPRAFNARASISANASFISVKTLNAAAFLWNYFLLLHILLCAGFSMPATSH